MIDLIRYFKILFISLRVGRERLKNFTEDHIQRLNSVNPGGIFTTILTDVTNAYTAYFGDMADESLAQAVLEGKTVGQEAAMRALKLFISKAEGLISYTFGTDSEAYQEFYPQGAKEYSDANISELETISLRFINSATAHAASLPATFVTDATALRTTFINNRNAQLGQKGIVANERSQLSGTKLALCTQLTKNVLTIALQYVGDETKAAVYFDQSILEGRSTGTETYDVEVAPNTLDNIASPDDDIPSYINLKIENTGSTNMQIGFCPNNTSYPNVPPGIVLAPGQEWNGTPADLGFAAGSNNYLNIYNQDGSAIGKLTFTVKR